MYNKDIKLSKGQKIAKAVAYTFLIFLSVTTLIPFLWMLLTSVKMNRLVFVQFLPDPIKWDNYIEIFRQMNFGKYYLNTLKVAVLSTLIQLATSSMAAYAFTKIKFMGRKFFYMLYIATMMVPSQVLLLPQFVLIHKMGLFDTHTALILLTAFSPFGVFMITQSFKSMSDDVLEAARIDGAGPFKVFIHVAVPMVKPALSALGIITFIAGMNEFMQALIYLNSEEKYVITLAIRNFSSRYITNTALQMAATCTALLPILILYVVAQKQIMEGVAFNGGGGIKG